MTKKINKFLYWTPRILSILFIIFLALMSLDVFGNGYSFWETALGLLIHNIPALILLVILIISRKYEIVWWISFILGGLLYSALILNNIIKTGFEWYYITWTIQISWIAFFIGIMFFLGRFRKKHEK